MNRGEVALCVSSDGAVTPANLFHETIIALLRHRPWRILAVLFWRLQGLSKLRDKLSSAVHLNWSALPVHQQVVSLIREARMNGRPVFLMVATGDTLAIALSKHLDVFDGVIPANSSILTERFGTKGYDYIGTTKTDPWIWKNARRAFVVTNSKKYIRQVRALTEIESVISSPRSRVKEYLRMLRIHQWLKNFLVFVPGVAAHRILEASVWAPSTAAFLAFGLCASSVYVVNDLVDLDNDRQHRSKYKRPLAAATVPIYQGLALVPVLLASALWVASILPVTFVEVLCGYFVITLLYSMWLKRQVIVDVMMLAGLYTFRVIAGATATGIKPSFWLLALSMFLFLSLALIKRYAELNVTLRDEKSRPVGRGYAVGDLPVLLSLGVSSGFVAVLIMALYINSPDLQLAYPNPIWLWFVPGLLLYWVSRMWMKTHRGEMHDDPVVFTARDWQSLVVVSLIVLCFLLASALR